MPIYNVEEYLGRCVDSILGQTYGDFDLILVDDESPDRCGEICDSYEKKRQPGSCVHKDNGGLSDARNAGLEIADGEFVCFIDSDDWVAPDYLEATLKAMIDNGSDICECGVLRTTGEDDPAGENSLQKEDAKAAETFSAERALSLLIGDQVLHQHVWNKLYRRHCLERSVDRCGLAGGRRRVPRQRGSGGIHAGRRAFESERKRQRLGGTALSFSFIP